MSYGWLTESTLLPKKSKPIKIDDQGSCFALKAVLQRQKQKANNAQSQRPNQKNEKINRGVQQRVQKDTESVVIDAVNRESKLQIKQKKYEQLSSKKRNINKLLVNFQDKKAQEEDEGEYQKQRQAFYSGRLKELKAQRQQEDDEFVQNDRRENAVWEKEVLQQLKGVGDKEEKVKQVFDRKMKDSQKQALNEIRKEITQQETIRNEAKKRRELIQMQRMIKIQQISQLTRKEVKSQKQSHLQKEVQSEKLQHFLKEDNQQEKK